MRSLVPLLATKLRLYADYVLAFGAVAGTRLFLSLRVLPVKEAKLISVRLPGEGGQIWLRQKSSDVGVFEQIFVSRDYDLKLYKQHEWIAQKIQALTGTGRRPVIIDCGANIGLSSIWFAREFPSAVVCAIEPSPGNFELLERNVAAFGAVIPIKAGIWDRHASLAIVNPNATAAEFQVAETSGDGELDMSARTIDEILEMVDHDEILLCKIDIEGAEAPLFRSNTSWLDRTDVLIIELHDWLLPWQGSSRNFISAIAKLHFDYLLKGENLVCFRDAGIPAQPRRNSKEPGGARTTGAPTLRGGSGAC
jgi:FkbM family methyltransferase